MLILFFSLIFILHNLEEYFFFKVPLKFKKTLSKKAFLYALILLSLTVLFLSIANIFIDSIFLKKIIFITYSAIFFNAIQHLILSCNYKKIIPGTITAICLIIPLYINYFVKEGIKTYSNFSTFIFYIILSIILMYASIVTSLFIGFNLTKIIDKQT